MWSLFKFIVDSFVQDKGCIDENISAASVSIINFMVKAPEDFKNANLDGKTPMIMILEMTQRIFQLGKELEDEITSMCAVTLIMAMIEHIGEGV